MEARSGHGRREPSRLHWWTQARDLVAVRELERSTPPGGWRRALDVGCGAGHRFPALARLVDSVEGIEPGAAPATPRRPDRTIHAVPFDERFDPGHRYDLVLLLDVLQRAGDPEAVVARATRLLEPGGLVLVTVPAWPHLRTGRDRAQGTRTRYDRRGLEALLETSLEVERSRYFLQWHHKATLARRAWEAVGGPVPAPDAVPPAPWNGALYALSVVDELLLGALPLPWGSSLVAVARKR